MWYYKDRLNDAIKRKKTHKRGEKIMLKILFVCHGNICRSTMAQFVFQDMVDNQGLKDKFYIDSAATSREEIGNPPHHGTVNKLRQEGIPVLKHRAIQMTKQDYEEYDYIIGMDAWNLRNMNRIQEEIQMVRFIYY